MIAAASTTFIFLIQRVSMQDTLEDGDTIAFLVGIAGG